MDPSDDFEKPTILIVDDSTENLKFFTNLLKGEYRIKVAINGNIALETAFSKNPPDLILLDVMMPGLDGYQVCKMLRRDERTYDIPVIFVTGKSSAEDELKGFNAGASDYVTKPVSSVMLKMRIKTQLAAKAHGGFLAKRIKLLSGEFASKLSELASAQIAALAALRELQEARNSDALIAANVRFSAQFPDSVQSALRSTEEFLSELSDGTSAMLTHVAAFQDTDFSTQAVSR